MADLPMPLMDELLQTSVPGAGGESAGGGINSLRPLVQSPMDDFMLTFLEFGDAYGILDKAMGPGEDQTIDERMEALGDQDLFGMLSKEQIDLLMQKFEALTPEEQTLIISAVREESPETYQSLQKYFRLVRGRDNKLSQFDV